MVLRSRASKIFISVLKGPVKMRHLVTVEMGSKNQITLTLVGSEINSSARKGFWGP